METKDSFPHRPEESLLEKWIFNSKRNRIKGLISTMYKTTIDNLLAYARYTNKTRWESDLGCIYTAGNWKRLLELAQTNIGV